MYLCYSQEIHFGYPQKKKEIHLGAKGCWLAARSIVNNIAVPSGPGFDDDRLRTPSKVPKAQEMDPVTADVCVAINVCYLTGTRDMIIRAS
jgi:hypothetical protein